MGTPRNDRSCVSEETEETEPSRELQIDYGNSRYLISYHSKSVSRNLMPKNDNVSSNRNQRRLTPTPLP